MDLKVSAQRLRLLLSWKETLRRATPQESYGGRSYRKSAARATAELRKEAEAAVRKAGSQLQALIATDADGPAAAQLRHRIQQLNHLLKAETAADLGGPIAMTLEGYADAFGAKRSAAFTFTKLERQDHITIGVSIVLTLVICLGLGWYHLWRANTTFTLERADGDHLALHFRNDGQNSAAFVGPWSAVAAVASNGATYGVRLYCKPRDEDSFQPCTSIGDVWIYQNEVMSPQRRITVESGVSITVLLDIRALESAYGAPLEAVRLECGRSGQRPQAVFTQSLEG